MVVIDYGMVCVSLILDGLQQMIGNVVTDDRESCHGLYYLRLNWCSLQIIRFFFLIEAMVEVDFYYIFCNIFHRCCAIRT